MEEFMNISFIEKEESKMEFESHSTPQTTLSVLSFSDDELVEALIDYAKQQGYKFEEGQIFIRHSVEEVENNITKLVVECKEDYCKEPHFGVRSPGLLERIR